MSLSWNGKQYEWTGSIQGLVAAVGDGDARLGAVVDTKSGAKVSMNISGSDDPGATEPFFIESPDGDNVYDASNRKEAAAILSRIRAGSKFPDMSSVVRKSVVKPRRKTKRRESWAPAAPMGRILP